MQQIPVPTPFPVGDVNAYLIHGEPLTLVDCGPLIDEAWPALAAAVEEGGRRLSDVRRLVLTHAHQDHAGLAERVRRASGCRVFAHPADVQRLVDVESRWAASEAFAVELCRRAGAPETHLRALSEWLGSHRELAEPLGEVEPLPEGDAWVVEGRGGEATPLTVLHTPGHARGALCLWDAGARELFSGDTLLGQISSNALAEPDPAAFRKRTLPLYLKSLARLAALGTARAFPGHGDVVEGDVKGLVDARLKFHDKRASRILGVVQGGVRTPWAIAERLFQGLPPESVFLAVSEVLGDLDLLAERGEAAFEGQDGGWEVRPA